MGESDRANSIAVTVANRVEEVARVERLVREFGIAHGLAPRTIHDFCVACDEMLGNIVKYAYEDEARHDISVSLELARPILTAEIEDDGVAFDPLSVPPPRLHGGIDERPIGGLGIYFVRKLMDEVSYARRGNRNVLVMKKRVEQQDTA